MFFLAMCSIYKHSTQEVPAVVIPLLLSSNSTGVEFARLQLFIRQLLLHADRDPIFMIAVVSRCRVLNSFAQLDSSLQIRATVQWFSCVVCCCDSMNDM